MRFDWRRVAAIAAQSKAAGRVVRSGAKRAKGSLVGTAAGRFFSRSLETPEGKKLLEKASKDAPVHAEQLKGVIEHLFGKAKSSVNKAAQLSVKGKIKNPFLHPLKKPLGRVANTILNTAEGATLSGAEKANKSVIGLAVGKAHTALDSKMQGYSRDVSKTLRARAATEIARKGKPGLRTRLYQKVAEKYHRAGNKGRRFLTRAAGQTPSTGPGEQIKLKLNRFNPATGQKETVDKVTSKVHHEAFEKLHALNRKVATTEHFQIGSAKEGSLRNISGKTAKTNYEHWTGQLKIAQKEVDGLVKKGESGKVLEEARDNLKNVEVRAKKWAGRLERIAGSELPEAKKAKEAVKTGVLNRAYGGTNLRIAPVAITAGTTAAVGAAGLKKGYQALKQEHEKDKYRKAERLLLENQRGIFRKNHPTLSEYEVDQMARQHVRLQRGWMAQQNFMRDELSRYKDLERFGAFKPKEEGPSALSKLVGMVKGGSQGKKSVRKVIVGKTKKKK